MNDVGKQSLTAGDGSFNVVAGRDVNFHFPSSRKTLAIVVIAGVTIWFGLWMFEIVGWPEWPLKWRKVTSDNLSKVLIEQDKRYREAGADAIKPQDESIRDAVNAKFTEVYTRDWGRVVWAGKVKTIKLANGYLTLRLDEPSLAAIEVALGKDRRNSLEEKMQVYCTFAKDELDDKIKVGDSLVVTGRVVSFKSKTMNLKSCERVP